MMQQRFQFCEDYAALSYDSPPSTLPDDSGQSPSLGFPGWGRRSDERSWRGVLRRSLFFEVEKAGKFPSGSGGPPFLSADPISISHSQPFEEEADLGTLRQ